MIRGRAHGTFLRGMFGTSHRRSPRWHCKVQAEALSLISCSLQTQKKTRGKKWMDGTLNTTYVVDYIAKEVPREGPASPTKGGLSASMPCAFACASTEPALCLHAAGPPQPHCAGGRFEGESTMNADYKVGHHDNFEFDVQAAGQGLCAERPGARGAGQRGTMMHICGCSWMAIGWGDGVCASRHWWAW